MRKILIAAVGLASVAGVALLWPELMAASYEAPLRGWFPREDPGVLLVVRQPGHQEEMAFGATSKAGVWLKATAQNNDYTYFSVKVADPKGRGSEVIGENGFFSRESDFAYPLPYGRNFFEPGAPPEDRVRIAMQAIFNIGYEEPRAAGGKATRGFQRILRGPIEISSKRPMHFEPATVKDLGFVVRAVAQEAEFQVMLRPIAGHQPSFATCWLLCTYEEADGSQMTHHTQLKPDNGGLMASIPISQVGSWMGHTLNTQIEVEVTAEGSAVTVSLKKPGT